MTRSCLFDADSLDKEIEFIESHRQALLEIRKSILEEIADKLNCGEQLQVSFLADTLIAKFNLKELEYLFQTENKLTEIVNDQGFNFYSGGLHWLVDCYRNFYISTSPTFLNLTGLRTNHFLFDPENLGVGTNLQLSEDNISTSMIRAPHVQTRNSEFSLCCYVPLGWQHSHSILSPGDKGH